MNSKYYLKCVKCNHIIDDFSIWFDNNQKCPKCGSNWATVHYNESIQKIKDLIKPDSPKPQSFWHYFDFLPLIDKKNIVTRGEGVIPAERWTFLEDYAKRKFNLNLTVYAYRNDLNQGTGTFKDVAASSAASILKEHGIKEYAIASTGNIATAYSHYLAAAGISINVFVPNDALKAHEAEVSSYGQRIFRVNGDYGLAKKIAAEFSEKNGILLSGGNTDPMRVEAKKTMVFEWLRQLGTLPNIYIQALSGGTGPIAIDKACDELAEAKIDIKLPRFIMVQPHNCDPMTAAWKDAKTKNFPEGWENNYPVYENPETKIPTLATGNPKTYPIIGKLVKKSNGEIISFDEDEMANVAKLVAYETTVKIGPASTVAVGGFFESLKQGLIKNGDSVLINVGEGVQRASELMNEMIYTTKKVDSVDECEPADRTEFSKELWSKFDKYAE
ncbi:MAG: pyridoxal-phosphate dependent enzyme [Chlorobi bacterium]|nr:pyridoxal-phosphate dependent enzyme [Chlorobiota bacterium]